MFSPVPQAMAQVDTAAFGDVVNPIITNIVNPAVELMVAVGIVVFVWGIVEMIVRAEDSDARKKGARHMMAGIAGIVIMLSAWAIIYVISNTVKGIH